MLSQYFFMKPESFKLGALVGNRTDMKRTTDTSALSESSDSLKKAEDFIASVEPISKPSEALAQESPTSVSDIYTLPVPLELTRDNIKVVFFSVFRDLLNDASKNILTDIEVKHCLLRGYGGRTELTIDPNRIPGVLKRKIDLNITPLSAVMTWTGIDWKPFPNEASISVYDILSRVVDEFKAGLTRRPDINLENYNSKISIIALILSITCHMTILNEFGYHGCGPILISVIIQALKNQERLPPCTSLLQDVYVKFFFDLQWIEIIGHEAPDNIRTERLMAAVNTLFFCTNLEPIPRYSNDRDCIGTDYNLSGNICLDGPNQFLTEVVINNFIPRYNQTSNLPKGIEPIIDRLVAQGNLKKHFQMNIAFKLECTFT